MLALLTSLVSWIGGLVVVVCVVLLRMLPPLLLLLLLLLWLIQHDCIVSILSTIFVIVIVLLIINETELRQRDIGRTAHWSRTPRLVARNANLPACRPPVTLPMTMCVCPASILPALTFTNTMLSAFKQDTPGFAAIRRRRSQTARHRRKTPFLDIGLNEHEAHLAEVDVHFTGTGGADGGEEVWVLERVRYVFELAAIAGEEDGSSARAIAYADDVADDIGWSVGRCGCERLVEAAVAGGEVGDGCFV